MDFTVSELQALIDGTADEALRARAAEIGLTAATAQTLVRQATAGQAAVVPEPAAVVEPAAAAAVVPAAAAAAVPAVEPAAAAAPVVPEPVTRVVTIPGEPAAATQIPATTQRLPAVLSVVDGGDGGGVTRRPLWASQRSVDLRAGVGPQEIGTFSRYRYPTLRDRGRSPHILAREYGPGDSELIEVVCRMHYYIARQDYQSLDRLLTDKRALTSATDAAGGFLVPDEFATDIIRLMADLTPFANRDLLRIVPMGTDRKLVPVATVRPDIQAYPEGATGEGGTDPAFGQVELITRPFGRTLPIGLDLLADMNVALVEYLRDLYAEILAENRNALFTNGDGTTQPEGVRVNASVGTSAFTGTEGVAADVTVFINQLYYFLKEGYRRQGTWMASSAMMEKLDSVVDADGRALLRDVTGAPFPTMKGQPVLENNAIPNNLGVGVNESELLFGAFKFYIMGDRQTLAIESNAGGKYFDQRQMALRVLERYDGKVGQPEAFVRGTDYIVA